MVEMVVLLQSGTAAEGEVGTFAVLSELRKKRELGICCLVLL